MILLSGLVITGCEKTEEQPFVETENGYFIFGHFYGECIGEGCVEIYKIEDEKLFEDSNDIYPLGTAMGPDPYPGNFQVLDQASYQEVAHLPDELPSQLFSETEAVLGQPDAGDWGGYYIEHSDGTVVRKWAIDTMKDNIPAYLHDFTDKIQQAIAAINN